jgi:hypothetical protein
MFITTTIHQGTIAPARKKRAGILAGAAIAAVLAGSTLLGPAPQAHAADSCSVYANGEERIDSSGDRQYCWNGHWLPFREYYSQRYGSGDSGSDGSTTGGGTRGRATGGGGSTGGGSAAGGGGTTQSPPASAPTRPGAPKTRGPVVLTA